MAAPLILFSGAYANYLANLATHPIYRQSTYLQHDSRRYVGTQPDRIDQAQKMKTVADTVYGR